MSNNPRAALLAAVKAQAKEIETLKGVVASLVRDQGVQGIQVGYIASLAGVSQQVEAIKKKADADNPAQPVPNPASEAPFETTEQAVTPETYDNVENPGMTPGSTNNIGADTTDVALAPGESLPTSPFNELENVQAPVAGTETQLPLNQTRIETDVRVGPQASPAANPEVAYPWTMASKRTFASIHLARLQIQAGLADETNDLVLGEKIATSDISDAEIASTINTLAGVQKAASKQQARPANLVPRSASVQRTTPSLAGGAAPLQVTSASVADDTADSDLFI